MPSTFAACIRAIRRLSNAVSRRLRVCFAPRLLVSLSLYLLFSRSPCLHASDSVIDSPMYQIPDLPVPPTVFEFPQKAKALWLRALERPEADMKIKAAGAIALARRRDVKGIETTIAPLVKEFDRSDLHPAARLAIAEALCALDARSAAPSFFQHAQSGNSDLRQLIEPVLARWDHAPARALWLQRLHEPTTPQRNLILAIQALAVVREAKAADRLRELALSNATAGPIRLEAAHALATLRQDGLEKDAAKLVVDVSPRGLVPRLVAAALLRQHRSPQAIELMQRLAVDEESAVAAGAAVRLIEIDPEFLVPALDRLRTSRDANLRTFAVEVLFRRPNAKHIALLGDQLDDLDPDVRAKARQALVKLAAKNELRDPVIASADHMLTTGQWRSREQAAIVLTQLDHKPAAKTLVELLAYPRPEVTVTAAWGLRKLAVPITLPAVTEHVRTTYQNLRAGKSTAPLWSVDHRLSQLNQFLGQQKHTSAEPVMRLFVPKPKLSETPAHEARAAAVWALGLIHDGTMVPDLAAVLEQRLNDTTSIPPEDLRVRLMCALTLGRLRAQAALPSLEKHCPEREWSTGPVSNACGWAIEQITGDKLPPPKTLRVVRRDWFLVPH